MNNTIIGSITTKQNLTGEISKAVEYLKPITQEKTITPTKETQEIICDKGYTGLSKVTVKAVTNEIDNNIQATNIKSGISILGITGTLQEGYVLELEDSTLIFSKEGSVKEGELIL